MEGETPGRGCLLILVAGVLLFVVLALWMLAGTFIGAA